MRTSFLGLLVALGAFAAAPAAQAATGPCLAGVPGSPTCTIWDAKISVVDDGDTVQARIKQGKGFTKRVSARINGLQAMELQSYSRKQGRKGDCHSLEATERLEQLVNNELVKLTAQKASSTTTGEGGRVRLRRSIAAHIGGKWQDVGAIMIREGHGLPFPNASEWASNGPYSRLAQEAAAAGRGIWDPDGCGTGPNPENPLSIKLKWDAEDNDAENVNGEWIRVSNSGATPVSLNGWWVRDSHFRGPQHGKDKGHGYVFPSNAVVPAGGSIRVHVGRGSNSATDLYWGLNESIFENASDDKLQGGDGAFLFDPKGNLREYIMYPCRAGNCTDPLKGKVSVVARYMGLEHEWVTIANTSAAPISLDGYELESVPWFYEFRADDVLEAGKSVVVWIDKPHEVPVGEAGVRRIFVTPTPGLNIPGLRDFANATFFRSWNHKDALLGDGKDVVTLRNPAGAPVECDAWGGEKCPSI